MRYVIRTKHKPHYNQQKVTIKETTATTAIQQVANNINKGKIGK